MNSSELLNARLHNQLLAVHHLKEPEEVVSWMGAMQSQLLEPAKWAIGARLQNKTVRDVDDALNTGKIIRTHVLRPTWHFVSPKDIHWMYDLSSPRTKPVYQAYCKTIAADESLIYRCVSIVEKALSGGKHLTKLEIGRFLETQDISLETNLLRMVVIYAEMEGIVVNGQQKGNKQTYTLLEEWAPRQQTLLKDEALARLAQRFFASHGPATLNDFAWWSGLTLTECKQALEMIKSDFVCETVNGRDFWMKNDIQISAGDEHSALLLPPFDEFVVSYKDRSELIDELHYGKVMTKNGLFQPTIMLGGRIVGSWKKTVSKNSPKIDLSFFEKTPKKVEQLFEPEIKRLECFYSTGKSAESK